jgi:hypothetical protein
MEDQVVLVVGLGHLEVRLGLDLRAIGASKMRASLSCAM